MASTKLTEYERKRLENIRRNEEMMASLKLQSMASQLSTSTKRSSEEAKSKKASPVKRRRTETGPIIIRRSLRTRGMPPDTKQVESPVKSPKYPASPPKPSPKKLGPLSMREAYWGEGSDQPLIEKIRGIGKECDTERIIKDESLNESAKEERSELEIEKNGEDNVSKAGNLSFSVKKEEVEIGGEEFGGDSSVSVNKIGDSLDVYSMTLKPDNIMRILSERIMAMRFFPCANSRMIVAGSKIGDIVFWNLDHEKDEEGDGVFTYHPHSGPVSGISIHPHSLSKVFTSCYDGFIRVMDAEKEVFDLIHYSEHAIFSLSQRSTDMKCLYFGEGNGGLNIWDERTGKCSTQRALHAERINSIDFNSENPNLMATSSSDGTACIWDLRSIAAKKPKNLKMVDHKRSIHSAYFSPSGKCLATTSYDDTVGILGGVNFEKSSRIPHNNQTGRWISPFKAIWGWDDSHIFIGNMKRGADVLSPALSRTIFTLQSPEISAIPCRFDIHPYNPGMLAGGTAGGKVYIWTQ